LAIERDLEKLRVENESLRGIINTIKKNVEVKEVVEKSTVVSKSEVEGNNADANELDAKLEEINDKIEEIANKCDKCDKCEFIGKSEAGLKIHRYQNIMSVS
jgi:predicted RNase H-like nuclease (RuvC/YqgF family)